jgi:adenosylhomocysteine nucleosidase
MTLVCFAVKEEAPVFRKLAGNLPGISILVTGMGRANSEKAVRQFLSLHPPRLVLTCGFAGGLDPALAPGAVLFETAQVPLAEKLLAAGARRAKFLCAHRVAVTAIEKKHLRETTGADVVEMESEAIQNLCREQGIPCATVRVISDAADEDLPLDFNRLYRPDMTLDFGKLAFTLLKSPGKISALMRLQKRCQFAATQLANVLVKVLPFDNQTVS